MPFVKNSVRVFKTVFYESDKHFCRIFFWSEWSFPKCSDNIQIVFGLPRKFFCEFTKLYLTSVTKMFDAFCLKFLFNLCKLSGQTLKFLRLLSKLFLWDFQNCISCVQRSYWRQTFVFSITSGIFLQNWRFHKFFSRVRSKLQFKNQEDRFWKTFGKTWSFLSLLDFQRKTLVVSRSLHRLSCQNCTVSVQQIFLTKFFSWKMISFRLPRHFMGKNSASENS